MAEYQRGWLARLMAGLGQGAAQYGQMGYQDHLARGRQQQYQETAQQNALARLMQEDRLQGARAEQEARLTKDLYDYKNPVVAEGGKPYGMGPFKFQLPADIRYQDMVDLIKQGMGTRHESVYRSPPGSGGQGGPGGGVQTSGPQREPVDYSKAVLYWDRALKGTLYEQYLDETNQLGSAFNEFNRLLEKDMSLADALAQVQNTYFIDPSFHLFEDFFDDYTMGEGGVRKKRRFKKDEPVSLEDIMARARGGRVPPEVIERWYRQQLSGVSSYSEVP